MSHLFLQAKNITCSRGNRLLLQDLNFTVSSGEILQVTGPNGVGKTSLLKILTGILPIESGEVLWQGQSIKKNFDEYYQNLFYLGHDRGIKSDLTVFENLFLDLKYQSRDHSKILSAIQKLDLTGFEKVLGRHLSQGQRQRVALAKLLLSEVQLWILDEPFAALDSVGVECIQELIQQQINKNGSVILSTHRPLTLNNCSIRTLWLYLL